MSESIRTSAGLRSFLFLMFSRMCVQQLPMEASGREMHRFPRKLSSVESLFSTTRVDSTKYRILYIYLYDFHLSSSVLSFHGESSNLWNFRGVRSV